MVSAAPFLQYRFTSSSPANWAWLARTRPPCSWLCSSTTATRGFSRETRLLPDHSSLQRWRAGKGAIVASRVPAFRATFSLSTDGVCREPPRPPRTVGCSPITTP